MIPSDARQGVALIKQQVFDTHLEAEPEEGTTLGAPGCDGRMRDYSIDGAESELARHRETIRAVEHLRHQGLNVSDQLDCDAMLSFARFRQHTLEDLEAHTCNIEASVYAHAIVQYQVARASTEDQWVDVGRRVEQIPRALAQQESLLMMGKQRRHTPDRTVGGFVVRHQLPAIAEFFATALAEVPTLRGVRLSPTAMGRLQAAAQAAARAYSAHGQFLSDVILSGAEDAWALGVDEYQWRLRNVFGLSEEPAALVAQAEAVIHDAQAELRRLGNTLGAGISASSLGADVMRATSVVLRTLERERPNDDEVVTLYEDLLERLSAFVRGRGLFRMKADERALVIPMPAGMLDGATISNWPAPLLNPARPGCVVLRPGSECHPKIRAPLLAAHEGIPGHFLQSAAWQRHFGREKGPVRFLNTADDVAILRQYYAPMLNIEGFATYAEELLREEHFYSTAEELFAVMCRIFRALRLVIDVGLHSETMKPGEAVDYIAEHTSFSRETAQSEIMRYQRLPMQGTTYLLGALQFEETRREARRRAGPAFRNDVFHERLLAFGPVPPSILRRHINHEVAEIS